MSINVMCNCPYTLCFLYANLRLTKWLQRLTWYVKSYGTKEVMELKFVPFSPPFPPLDVFICSIIRKNVEVQS